MNTTALSHASPAEAPEFIDSIHIDVYELFLPVSHEKKIKNHLLA